MKKQRLKHLGLVWQAHTPCLIFLMGHALWILYQRKRVGLQTYHMK